MLRLVMLMLLLGARSQCFSADDDTHHLQEWQMESLNHLGYGFANLLTHEHCYALEEFQKANSLLDLSDNSSSLISFLICFGQSIAYDALGFSEKCNQAIGSLFFAMNRFDEDDPGFDFEAGSGSFEYDSSVNFLRDLVTIAPSREVRELLNALIDDIEEQLLPDFTFAKRPVLGSTDYVFQRDSNDLTVNQCKSFWKKFEKSLRKIGEFLGILEKISKDMKNIKKNIDDMRASNQYQNPHYVDPNMRIN